MFRDTETVNTDTDDPAIGEVIEEDDADNFINLSAQISSNPTHRRYGIAVTDFDLNGDYEVVITGYGAPNEVYDYRGGQWFDIAPSAIKDEARQAIGVAACDIDGDGAEEVAQDSNIADPQETVRGVATLDANEDGLFDIVYGNWEGPHRLFIAQADDQSSGMITYEDQAPELLSAPSKVRTVIAADFDNDGYEELFFNHIGEPNRLFRRSGESWVPVELNEALEPNGLGTGAAVADTNRDGILELWIAHGESGAQPLSLYPMERSRSPLASRSSPHHYGGSCKRCFSVTLLNRRENKAESNRCGERLSLSNGTRRSFWS